MKFVNIVIICLIGLAASACETNPVQSGNIGPGSFTGNLNDLGIKNPADTAPTGQ
jgi:hypothetical protein